MSSVQAQQQQDVMIDYDSEGHIIVDRYAKALDILDGDNEDIWEYERVVIDGVTNHYAKLLGGVVLDVKGAQPMAELSPQVNYNVYLDLKVEDGADGFTHPVIFEFTDQNLVPKNFSFQLKIGDNMVQVGQFLASPDNTPNVSVKLYDHTTGMKKGLVVRRMRITTA